VKKDIRSLLDLTESDFIALFDRAAELKDRRRRGIADTPLAGKTLGLLFDKASTRTRVSFETAAAQLGGTPLFISAGTTQMVRAEPVADTARVLSRYLDGLAIRTYSQDLLEELANHSEIPVINALTDRYHPCQVLSDLMTVIEKRGGYRSVKIAWVGDGNNVAHSWINAAAVLGLSLTLACPEGFFPDEKILEVAQAMSRGVIEVTADPEAAVADAGVIYTDVWASMGQEAEAEDRKSVFMPYQVNAELLRKAPADVIVMHCLPAHRGEEITDEVLEGPASVVWDQAENKMHMHKAILEALMA
jgi:ornithine carbamoyltransferase